MSLGDRLTTPQRACLLRAARKQLEQYNDALQHLTLMGASDAELQAAITEIQCVQGAIAWLWRDQRTA